MTCAHAPRHRASRAGAIDDGLRAGLLPAPQALALVLALLGRAPRHRLRYLRVPTLRDAGDDAVGNISVNTICP